jgi:predicted Zn finger-like uncharacterized protein
MLVPCPKCQTTYRVSDDIVKGAATAPTFRCSRCKHTFEIDAQAILDAAKDGLIPEESSLPEMRKDQEPSLPFDSKSDPASRDAGEATRLEESAAHSESAGWVEPEEPWSLAPDPKEEHQFEFPESARPAESRKGMETAHEFAADDRFFQKAETVDEGNDGANILAISSYREQNASVLPFITLLALLIIGFTFMSVVSYAKPQASDALIKHIPLVGHAVLRNDHLKRGILIQSLRYGYQTIQGNREVFLISGVALNQNPEVVREIQLSAVTYDTEGKEVERQTIWAGNTISPKIIRGMTTEDIPHLQNLKPLKTFEVPPGDSIPFTIVFLKSAKSAKEFTCEVLTAGGAI